MTNALTKTILCAVVAVLTAGCVSRSASTARTTVGQDEKLQFEPGPQDADAPTEFTQTASGLKYRILRKSDGANPKSTHDVTCHYRGWLDNGREFDSSYTEGKPITFNLAQVIPGWTEGVQLVGEGGMIELEIPSELGYGTQGAGNSIPPNSQLHFIVELIKIE